MEILHIMRSYGEAKTASVFCLKLIQRKIKVIIMQIDKTLFKSRIHEGLNLDSNYVRNVMYLFVEPIGTYSFQT